MTISLLNLKSHQNHQRSSKRHTREELYPQVLLDRPGMEVRDGLLGRQRKRRVEKKGRRRPNSVRD